MQPPINPESSAAGRPDGDVSSFVRRGAPPSDRGKHTAIVTASALAAADAAIRAAGVRAAPLERARATQAERERARLAAKHGEHAPRTLAAGVRATARAIEATAAQLVATRAQVPPVRPTTDGTIVHGRVVDGERQPRAGVEVAVRVDERTVVKAVTDRDGYYRVDVPTAAITEASGRRPLVGAPRPVAVDLMASRGAQPLMRAGAGVTITEGRVLYRELVVDDDGGPER